MRVLQIVVAAGLVACAHAQPAPESTAPQQPAARQAPPAPLPAAPPASTAQVASNPGPGPASIYFDYDSSTLKPGARSELDQFAQAIRTRPDLHVRIEGNCDERGTTEYNLALGQHRADAAKKYLERLGLDASRVTAVSNGNEKPRAPGHDEDSWRENRRDDLLPANDTVGMR
ncbi:MAG TPA: OmpA family protein [Myxococcales bacterium]|nr:OmpA family protein [Myxococcales bacterium]